MEGRHIYFSSSSSSSFTFGPYRHSGYKETFFAIKSKRKRGSRVLVLVRQRFCPSHSFADIDKPKICPSSHSPHLHHLLNELWRLICLRKRRSEDHGSTFGPREAETSPRQRESAIHHLIITQHYFTLRQTAVTTKNNRAAAEFT